MKNKNRLRFIALSGTTGVTENLYLYEYGDDMIMVDCGVGFPEPEMFGIDLVIPDFDFIRRNKNKLKAILISHGHEDHLGALPFLLKEMSVPIYSTKLVSGFIQDKLNDYRIKGVKLNVFNPEEDVLTLGSFRITPFRVSHSVPDGVGFAIETPEGTVFHVADYKFDWTPVDGKPFDVQKAAILASRGCLAVVSDCLGSTTQGFTESEETIESRIENIVSKTEGQVFFTTISSNISRMKQAIRVAQKYSRKVCFIGRSIDRKAEIARDLGYLKYPDNVVVRPKQASQLQKDQIMYIISGSYGQPGSALYRLALGEHDFLSVDPEDVVVFSSDPAPPGSKGNVDFVVDKLIEANIDVHYYDLQEDLHVSGHGSMEDIKMLFALLKPKYYIPIGGTIRHMRAYRNLACNMGAKTDNVLELMPGESVEFSNDGVQKGESIEVRNILVDGLGIGDVGNVVLRDRHLLSKEGIAVVIIQYDNVKKCLSEPPDIISRGFVFQAKKEDFLSNAGKRFLESVEKRRRVEKKMLRDLAIDFFENYFYEKTGRRPMILPVIVEV